MTMGQVVLMLAGNTGLFALIIALIQRRDQKKSLLAALKKAVEEIKEKMEAQNLENKRDMCRQQLLLLMAVYPQEKQEILTVAKHYFVDLGGNWYASSIFQRFLKDNEIEPPLWFLNHEPSVK